MLERLVPSSVTVAETREDLLDIDLYPAEQEALGRAVEKRRRQFTTGRACARLALRRLGAPVVAIPSGPRGEPLWPAGVVGSITHCDGYRACAVARSEVVLALGIDAEPNGPLPDGVLEEVVHGRERDLVEGRPPRMPDGEAVDLARLVFSAKEAVYKAWFPLKRRWLGFEDAEVSVDPAVGAFRARLLVPGPIVGGTQLTEFAGRWTLQDGIICTAVVVPQPTWPYGEFVC
ncbi:MAG TPA: 4'-phosphopantetheinyl transferase superfamily protein [Baekduia sp.]|nr:4'-phosphopantetheinyl transferase superfamily protein [Baekduia sp.]